MRSALHRCQLLEQGALRERTQPLHAALRSATVPDWWARVSHTQQTAELSHSVLISVLDIACSSARLLVCLLPPPSSHELVLRPPHDPTSRAIPTIAPSDMAWHCPSSQARCSPRNSGRYDLRRANPHPPARSLVRSSTPMLAHIILLPHLPSTRQGLNVRQAHVEAYPARIRRTCSQAPP
jgi:hypothetical protein